MSKHRKCEKCNGNGKILKEEYSPRHMRMMMVEKTCPKCNGTGYEEKENNNDDHVRVLG
jgi:DnaJ-class molecular chaperone